MALKEETQKVETILKEVQSQLSSRSQDLDTTNGAITDMKARLGFLDKEIESTDAREKLLMTGLSKARNLQKDAEEKLDNQIQQRDLWIKKLVDIVEHLTAQIEKMDIES